MVNTESIQFSKYKDTAKFVGGDEHLRENELCYNKTSLDLVKQKNQSSWNNSLFHLQATNIFFSLQPFVSF